MSVNGPFLVVLFLGYSMPRLGATVDEMHADGFVPQDRLDRSGWTFYLKQETSGSLGWVQVGAVARLGTTCAVSIRTLRPAAEIVSLMRANKMCHRRRDETWKCRTDKRSTRATVALCGTTLVMFLDASRTGRRCFRFVCSVARTLSTQHRVRVEERDRTHGRPRKPDSAFRSGAAEVEQRTKRAMVQSRKHLMCPRNPPGSSKHRSSQPQRGSRFSRPRAQSTDVGARKR